MTLLAPSLAMLLVAASPGAAWAHDGATGSPAKAPGLAAVARSLRLTYDRFTLPNGLRVVVHTDRTAPLVSVAVLYDVGSRDEPAGRAGFAHLFEHLMFNGSANAPGFFPGYMKEMGATFNGTTDEDLTRYYEVVPTPSLARTLFLESDRMGYLLGALTQAKLDKERSVVANEKRQGMSAPLAFLEERLATRLHPPGDPYGHTVIGSMANLGAASLDDVRRFFIDHYGPNNAVLVLVGDVDVPTARRLATTYFGDIPRGPKVTHRPAAIVDLPQRIEERTTARVAAPTLVRAWTVPGNDDPDAAALNAGIRALNDPNGPLRATLVDREKLFSDLSIGRRDGEGRAIVQVIGTVAGGIDPDAAGRRLDQLLATVLAAGPGTDEVERAKNAILVDRIYAGSTISAQARALGQGALWGDDPDLLAKRSEAVAAAAPPHIRATLTRWLTRPAYALTVLPGAPPVEQPAGETTDKTAPVPDPASPPVAPQSGVRPPMPPVGEPTALAFPTVAEKRLSNGMLVRYLNTSKKGLSGITLSLDAGKRADAPSRCGVQPFALALLGHGTADRSAAMLRSDIAALGARIGSMIDDERSSVQFTVPSANFGPGVALLADVARYPRFAADDIARQRAAQLSDISGRTAAGRPEAVLQAAIDPASPYICARSGGDVGTVSAIGGADLAAWQDAWLRPDKATLLVTSDLSFADVTRAVERVFGSWHGGGPAGAKPAPARSPAGRPEIVIVDRPGRQSVTIMAQMPTPLAPIADLTGVTLGQDALSGRINANLRERRQWSYGAAAALSVRRYDVTFGVAAAVQADRAGDALRELQRETTEFVTTRPLTADEFDRSRSATLRAIGTDLGSLDGYLDASETDRLLGRAPDYRARVADGLEHATLERARRAFADAIDPSRFTWVLVGDAAAIRRQIGTTDLPVRVIEATPG